MHNATDYEILEALSREIWRQVDEGYERLDTDSFYATAPWSRRQTERRFRERYLTSPARYFRDCQWEQAHRLLRDGHDVLSVSAGTGFASPGRLHDAVVARSGMTPGEVRRGGEGVHVDYGFFETQLGVVMIAATRRGMTSLYICGASPSADDLSKKVEELRSEIPHAELDENTEVVQVYANQLVEFLEARTGADFCPELDILRGTTFQREVWSELQKIKPGETITYTELARRVGRPGAVRAVANACADNTLAIAIPCHRCIRQDGTLAGYRWGVEWKRKLLQLEAERHRTQIVEPMLVGK